MKMKLKLTYEFETDNQTYLCNKRKIIWTNLNKSLENEKVWCEIWNEMKIKLYDLK